MKIEANALRNAIAPAIITLCPNGQSIAVQQALVTKIDKNNLVNLTHTPPGTIR